AISRTGNYVRSARTKKHQRGIPEEGGNMTNEEKESLLWHGTNIPSSGLEGLIEYVQALLEKEYDKGHNDGDTFHGMNL
ncbi:hypothetical protein LCGC14_2546970, partial [marine sediment metagenome]